jgi:hypothetical protein
MPALIMGWDAAKTSAIEIRRTPLCRLLCQSFIDTVTRHAAQRARLASIGWCVESW